MRTFFFLQRAKRHRWMPCLGALLTLAISTCQTLAVTPHEIDESIERGKKFLLSIEKNNNWEQFPSPDPKDETPWSVHNGQYGGMTAIATYALLASGESPQSPAIANAIKFLKQCDMHGDYAIGLRSQVWNMIPMDDGVRDSLRKDRDLLLAGVHTQGAGAGMYGYLTKSPPTDFDHSVSQFAVLGAWAVNQAGAEVPTNYWTGVENSWINQQHKPQGSWSYGYADDPKDARNNVTLSMTAAGVATLFITQDYTNFSVRCTGNVSNPSIDAGMVWLGKHLGEMGEPRQFYTLFGISRVGLAGGFKYIGNYDWFQWGADYIIKSQKPNGCWDSGFENPNLVVDTSFALLFLSRGRAPVMMNKLEYENVAASKTAKPQPASWNQRPRDVANLARMVGKQLEIPQNWQVVNLRQGLRDLHDAPILYMSGSTIPRLSAQDQQNLKQYIEEGGLLLGHADCSAPAFAEGFRKLGESMFPGRTFGPLPMNDPIYTEQNFVRNGWRTKPPFEGLSNGDRQLMLLFPAGDPGKIWQTQAFPSFKTDYVDQLVVDILLYVHDQQLPRAKTDSYLVNRREDLKAAKAITVARLKYTGNWDPEPAGWRRMSNVMHNSRSTDVNTQVIELGQGKLASSFNAADLVANGKFTLTEAQQHEIQTYVNGGGTLIVDVAGGKDGQTAVEGELVKIFPDNAGKEYPRLPLTSPVYTAGGAIKEVAYRRPSPFGSDHHPRLRGILKGTRVAVIYSPEDVTAGLVGEPIGGIIGYTPESAMQIMCNCLTYASQH